MPWNADNIDSETMLTMLTEIDKHDDTKLRIITEYRQDIASTVTEVLLKSGTFTWPKVFYAIRGSNKQVVTFRRGRWCDYVINVVHPAWKRAQDEKMRRKAEEANKTREQNFGIINDDAFFADVLND